MRRLFLRILVGMLLAMAASFFILNLGILSTMRKHFREIFPAILSDIDLAKRRLEAVPAQQAGQELARLRDELPYPLRLIDPDLDPVPAEVLEQTKAGRTLTMTQRTTWLGCTDGSPASDGGRMFYVSIHKGTRMLVLGPMRARVGGSNFPFLAVIVAICLVVSITGLLLAAPMVRRLEVLERAARSIGDGDLEARAAVSSNDSIGCVARQFNLMADRIQLLLDNQTQLIQAVSHELRTPTARIRFGLEMLATAGSDQERQRRIESIDEDLSELDQLVEELVLFVRSGDKSLQLDRQPVALLEPIGKLVGRYGDEHPGTQIELTLDEDGQLQAVVDERLFVRAISNLVANAVRHGSGKVAVRLARMGDAISVAVCDDGPGIPQDDRAKVFEPFARLGASRSRESGGVGLGLAIVRRIVEAHGGTVTVDDSDLGGAALVTTWPTI